MRRGAALLVTFVFVLSGIAALIFETLWFRQASIAFGSSVWASALVLSSFMAGTAAGNGLAARYGGRVRRPLVVYAALELTIATGGLSLVLLLPAASATFGALLSPFLLPPPLLSAARFSVAFVVLAAPAVAMGATLPTLVSALSAARLDFGRLLGRLYGWNTLGAVAGALAAELVLIPALGIRGSGVAAASLNVAAALVAIGLARAGPPAPAAPPVDAPRARLSPKAARLLVGAFLCGALLLALEVVWFRILVLALPHGPETFAWMLAVVLAGIGLGGLAASSWLSLVGDAERDVALVALASGVAAIAPYAALPGLSDDLATTPPEDVVALLRVATPLMLPTSLASGVLFTFIGKALHAELPGPMRAAGLLTLANTVGAGIGPLLAGFVLLPRLGMEASVFALATGYGLVAASTATRVGARRRAAHVVAAAIYCAALVAFPFGMLGELIEKRIDRAYGPIEHVIARRESVTGTLIYSQADFLGEPYYYRLSTDGYSMSGTGISARRYMSLFVHLPVAFHPELRDALLISYGVGTTARTLTELSELESIDVVDISRATLEMSDIVFGEGESPLDDPRVEVFIEDGRYFLQTTDRTYDLITAEPPPPAAAGVVNLYTLEYFRLLRSRLREGGVVSYWLPVAQFSPEESKSIVRAFCTAFDDCTLWEGIPQDWILLGTRDAEGFLTDAVVRRQWRDDATAAGLRARGVASAEQLGALFLADAGFLTAWSADAPPLVDDWPSRAPRWATPRGRQQEYETLMDPRAASDRFASSAFIAKMWPAPLRKRTLPYFAYEGMARAYLIGEPDVTLPRLHRLLEETDLVTLPLWLLGSDADRQAIAASLDARGDLDAVRRAEVDYHLGLGALAARDFGGAADRLVRVPDDGRFPAVAYQRLYALCSAGRREDARRFAASFPNARAPQNDRFFTFLEATFGRASGCAR